MPDREGVPSRPHRRTRARGRCSTQRALQRTPSGGQARHGGVGTRGRQRSPSGGHARDGGARPEGAPARPPGGHARDGGADPEDATARPLRRTRERRRRSTPRECKRDSSDGHARNSEGALGWLLRTRARQLRPIVTACRRSPSGEHARDSGARPRGRAGAATQADTRATAAPDLERASAPVRRTCSLRRRPTATARWRDP